MPKTSRAASWVIGISLLAAGSAQAQSNLDAGKSPAEIFSDTCGACHQSPQGLRPTNATFLRKHYTTGPRQAALMAGYLETVANDPPAAVAAKPRRPSDSVEEGMLPQAAAPGSGDGAASPPIRHADFEE